MYRIVQTFIDQLIESNDVTSLSQCMSELAATLDLSCFAYLALPSKANNTPSLISTYPSEWTKHYLQRHYERFDPVVVKAADFTQPFQWGVEIDLRTRSEIEHKLFEEAASFGIRCGFTIPIHDNKGNKAAVTFATDELRIPFERSINGHAQILQLLAIYFHAHATRMLRADRLIDGVLLSPREFECLKWSSLGKSAWDIGNILGISRRTAAFHLDNVRAKLGVRTIRQAVVRLADSRSRK